MTSLFQGNVANTQVVGQKNEGHLPGPFRALKQGSEGEVMSELQLALKNEKKQHQERYNYEHGHN